MTGNVRYGYIPPRPGPRERHQARRILLVLGASVAAGAVIGWRLGR
jgi:hypothetical protein